MNIWIALDITINNFCKTYALKRYVWFSLHHFPNPQYFLHFFLSCHCDQLAYMEQIKTINVLIEEFKGKDTFFVNKCLRQKGL